MSEVMLYIFISLFILMIVLGIWKSLSGYKVMEVDKLCLRKILKIRRRLNYAF
jgi:hypothetical protein